MKAAAFALLAGVVSSSSLRWIVNTTVHDNQPALDYVVVNPNCEATIYNFKTGSFDKKTGGDIKKKACADPISHIKATVESKGLSWSCAYVQQEIRRQAALFATGTDSTKVYDPHGTGRGYIASPDAPEGYALQFVRLAGKGGKGMEFYQDTVNFKFSDGAGMGGCSIYAVSQSQVSAQGDGGTNVCNIFNLISRVALSHGQLTEFKDLCCNNDVSCALPEEEAGMV